MAISNYTLNKIYNYYKEKIEGVKISKIVKISDYDFSFILYSKKNESIIFSLEPLHPYFLMSSSYFKSLTETNNFVSNLKKYFENGVIKSINKLENDRVIIFEIKKVTQTYQTIINKLILELIPHRTNAIIVNENNIIISALKYSSTLDDKNLVARGVHYLFKESENKNIVKTDTLETIKSKIGLTLYKDILYRIENGEKFENILNEILTSDKYYVYKNDILSTKLHSLPSKEISLEEISKIYEQKENEKYKKEHYDLVFHLVKHKLKGLKNKLSNLEKDYQKNIEKNNYVEYGNLLLMGVDKYVKGSKEIVIEGIKIELDEKLNLIENANKYFKQYQKSKKAIEELSKQKQLTLEKIDFFEKIENQITFASIGDMEDIIYELKQNGYIKENQKKKTLNKKQEKIFTPHIIEVDGFKIGFGLSSYQNDYLTFSLANNDDYFFHIKNQHGPHVIIFSNNPSKEAILFASETSVYLSRRTQGEVFLADRKDVRKIPGKIGKVTLDKYQTIYINSIRESTINTINDHIK